MEGDGGGGGSGSDEQVTDTINTRTVKSNRSRLSFISIRKLNKSEPAESATRPPVCFGASKSDQDGGMGLPPSRFNLHAHTHIRVKWPIVICMNRGRPGSPGNC